MSFSNTSLTSTGLLRHIRRAPSARRLPLRLSSQSHHSYTHRLTHYTTIWKVPIGLPNTTASIPRSKDFRTSYSTITRSPPPPPPPSSSSSPSPPHNSQDVEMSEPTGLIAKSGIELLTFGMTHCVSSHTTCSPLYYYSVLLPTAIPFSAPPSSPCFPIVYKTYTKGTLHAKGKRKKERKKKRKKKKEGHSTRLLYVNTD